LETKRSGEEIRLLRHRVVVVRTRHLGGEVNVAFQRDQRGEKRGNERRFSSPSYVGQVKKNTARRKKVAIRTYIHPFSGENRGKGRMRACMRDVGISKKEKKTLKKEEFSSYFGKMTKGKRRRA